jgi:hypothetical protein
VFGVLLYHTLRQLRLVNTINAKHIRINLYHIRSLQAFSKLTGTTAVGLVVFVYVWMFINPDLLRDPLIIGYAILFTLLAMIVFIWPLYGVHRLMVLGRDEALQRIDLQFEVVFQQFNQKFHDNDFPAIERLNGTIASLEIQHNKIQSISTWPWSSETGQFVLTAIALPLALMILQFLIEQVLN